MKFIIIYKQCILSFLIKYKIDLLISTFLD